MTQHGRAPSSGVARACATIAGVTICLGANTARAASDGGVHPEAWPQARSAGLIDKATEARITALLTRMSLEEKVGQVIQTDIGEITPEDLRRYPLGSILAGGGSGPKGDERASADVWLALSRSFHAVAIEPRAGHTPVPLLFGIDAVHGHNNVVGAVIYPHNIGLGAAHDANVVRRIGTATAEALAATGIDWTFAPRTPLSCVCTRRLRSRVSRAPQLSRARFNPDESRRPRNIFSAMVARPVAWTRVTRRSQKAS
jgi:hypothetical protein